MTREQFATELDRQVKLVRTEYGFTQDTMAKALGLSKKTLVQIEKGRASLGWTGAVALSAVFADSQVLAGVLGGWSMLKFIAGRLAPREHLSRVWIYLGRHTIPVICLHVLCFKAVTWLYIRVRGLPAIYLASFHIDFDAGGGWKLLYLAAGLGGSLLLAAAWHSLVRCICQRSVRS